MSSVNLSGASSYLYPQLSNATINQSLLEGSGAAATGEAPGSLQATNPLLSGIASNGLTPNGELFLSLQSAVTNALQTAQSGSDQSPDQIVQNAITKVLQGSAGATSTSSTGSSSSGLSSSSTSGTAASVQSFFQLLSDFGVNVQQFQNDFQAVVQQAQQGGQADAANVFSSFPNGLAVDTVG